MTTYDQYLGYLTKEYFKQLKVPERIYKYRPFNQYSVKNIASNSLWFSYVDEFNDPFESKLTAPIDMWIEQEKAVGRQTTREELEPVAKHYCKVLEDHKHMLAACSFAKDVNNVLMWSHYANSHTGFCLEFIPAKDINYFYSLLPIQYEREFKPAELVSGETNILNQLFLRKSNFWHYEKEYRLIKKEKGSHTYSPSALSAVIFGVNTSDEDRILVKRILGSTVQYKRCEINPYSQSLDIACDY